MYYLPTSLIFIGYSIITFIYVFKNRREKIQKHLFLNELLIVLLLLMAGILFPFMFQFHSPQLANSTLNFLWLFTSIFFLIEMGVWSVFLIYNAIISKRNPEIMAERDYDIYCKEVNNRWVDFKSEFGRKFLHLLAALIIFFFWSLGTILDNLGFLSQLNLDNYSFSYWLIITVGYGFVIMFQIADLSRLNKFYILPGWAKRWLLAMRPSELDTFIASTPLVLSLIPFVFAPFPILASVALITTGADAAACLIGKKYGSHSLKKGSNKTIEGFIAGGITTFLIVFIIMNMYQFWMPISFIKILMMSLVSVILFLLVDFYIEHLSDNILNPILTGLGMWLILLL